MLKIFVNLQTHSKIFRGFPSISEHFRKFPKIFENLKKIVGESFWEFSDIFQFFPIFSEDFRRFIKIQKCWNVFLSTLGQFPNFFRRFPKTSEDFRRFSKISETCWNVGFCTLRCFFPSFPKSFQNIQQRITLTSGNWPTREFFKKFKFNSPCGLVKFWYFLKISLVQINSKLHSK